MRIGVDVGGVLIEKDGRLVLTKEDTTFNPDSIEWVDGALDALTHLKGRGHQLFIVSYCGQRRETETRAALKSMGVPALIPEEDWHFTRSRQGKAPVVDGLDLDVFIDDTDQVCKIVANQCQNPPKIIYWFRGKQKARLPIVTVQGWSQIKEQLE